MKVESGKGSDANVLAVMAVIVTQENSLAAVGMPPRAFREYVNRKQLRTIRFGKKCGKLVGVELSELLAALRADADRAEPADDLQAIREAAGLRVVGGNQR